MRDTLRPRDPSAGVSVSGKWMDVSLQSMVD